MLDANYSGIQHKQFCVIPIQQWKKQVHQAAINRKSPTPKRRRQ